jgi:predicted acylesterase/phospholipase RssA
MSGPTSGPANGAGLGNGQRAAPRPQLRLAAAFTGGVSLAVWMGGMAREMNLLLAASRMNRGEEVPGTSEPGQRVRAGYAALLDLLGTDVSIDVLSGTSAGGINAAILGLANVQRLDLDRLRELWFTEGSLSGLLRNPADKNAPSLLYGDKTLLAGLRTGLNNLAAGGLGNPAPGQDPTRVFLTTTLLAGEASRFTDEYGTLVRDINHHGLFSFSSADLTEANVPALALAARCSASFPVAFEPGLIPIGMDGGDGHPDMAAFSNTQASQFAADGGLLTNRPLGPALQAVFDRPAESEVRRVLAFVVPQTGGPTVPRPKLSVADTPDLPAALAADLTALTAQTISGDLAAITAHNQQVGSRNDARQQLAVLGRELSRLADPFYAGYRQRRAQRLAQTAANEVLTQTTVGHRAADGRPAGFGTDAEQAQRAAAAAVLAALPAGLPAVGDYGAMSAAGREALDDARATVLAVLSRAYPLVPPEGQRTLGRLRLSVSQAMPPRPEPSASGTVARVLGAAPAAGGGVDAAAAASQTAAAAQALLGANMAGGSSGQPWRDLAAVLIGLRSLPGLDRMAGAAAGNGATAGAGDPAGDGAGNGAADAAGNGSGAAAASYVADLLRYLTGPAGGDWVDTVAARLFDLHVARYVMQPDGLVADQALELIQMSADTRTSLDPRTLAAEKLTGLQLHHFGAFCKASWRANDWMWGRLDGAGWLVHMLLAPRRLHELALESGDPETFRTELRGQLERIAGSPAPAGVFTPFPAKDGHPPAPAELDFLTASQLPPPPVSLPMTAIWVASGLQQIIAGEELAYVAQQVGVDAAQGGDEGAARAFLAAYHAAAGKAASDTAGASHPPPVVPDTRAAAVLHTCRIPAETITGQVGSQLFTQTVTRAAAVAVKTVDLGKGTPHFLRPVLTGARTVTTLAWRVTSVGPAAKYPLVAGLVLILLGALASTSTVNVLSAAGLAAVLAGLLLVAVGAARRIVLALAIVTVAAGAALAAAAYIPYLRSHLFPWLEKTVLPSLAKHPAQWAILVLFVLLPPLWTIAAIVHRLIRRSPPSSAAAAAAVAPVPAPVSSGPPPSAQPGAAPVAGHTAPR